MKLMSTDKLTQIIHETSCEIS